MKKRLREGAKLIVIDPRRIDLVRMPHVQAAYHLPLLPGTNVAILSALAHVIVTEGLVNEAFVRESAALTGMSFRIGRRLFSEARNSPEQVAKISGVPAGNDPRCGAALRYRSATARSITVSASPSIAKARLTVIAIANLAMAHRQHRPAPVFEGVNPITRAE